MTDGDQSSPGSRGKNINLSGSRPGNIDRAIWVRARMHLALHSRCRVRVQLGALRYSLRARAPTRSKSLVPSADANARKNTANDLGKTKIWDATNGKVTSISANGSKNSTQSTCGDFLDLTFSSCDTVLVLRIGRRGGCATAYTTAEHVRGEVEAVKSIVGDASLCVARDPTALRHGGRTNVLFEHYARG